MRQVGDTLVWLGLIAVVAAVVYFTPRVAKYVSTREAPPDGHRRVAWVTPGGEVESYADEMR